MAAAPPTGESLTSRCSISRNMGHRRAESPAGRRRSRRDQACDGRPHGPRARKIHAQAPRDLSSATPTRRCQHTSSARLRALSFDRQQDSDTKATAAPKIIPHKAVVHPANPGAGGTVGTATYASSMTAINILKLILGPLAECQLAEGQSVHLSDIKMADILARFDTVDLTTPVHPLPAKEAEWIEYVREELRTPGSSRPLTSNAFLVEWIIRCQLELYIESDHPRADRLYVLEFQGPWQYVMFGYTANLLRRVTEHQRAASVHGFALVNGWASPWVENAKSLEYNALFYAGLLHHHDYRERFFDMPFEFGVKIMRLVFEGMSDWQSRSGVSSAEN
jgi:hypothetical protein